MAKYDEFFKWQVVQDYQTGSQGVRALAKRHGIDESAIRKWIASYREHGRQGLSKKYSRYDAAFKFGVLQHMQQEELSARQTAAVFNIRGIGVICKWQRLYDEGGLQALQPAPRGRSKTMTLPKSPPNKPVPTADTSELEVLRQENDYLRAEVAYLKKLEALLQAKKQAALKKRR